MGQEAHGESTGGCGVFTWEQKGRQSSCVFRGDCVELAGFVYKSFPSHLFQRMKVSSFESPQFEFVL